MSSTHDDSFREIQLSGKQVVFYFMAAVVFLVVVFLMGVQVGRGVLSQRGLPEAGDGSAFAAETEPPPPAASQEPSAPLTANEKLSYAERLAASEPAAEQLKKAEDAPPPTPKSERSAEAAAGRESGPQNSGPPPRPAAATADPAGTGFSIQVAALRERSQADTIAKRLVSKGYPAYVLAPAKGAASIFRVQVGKYKDRREADTVAAKLQKEEQFKPWVVR
jgi:cell division septation protein DedD